MVNIVISSYKIRVLGHEFSNFSVSYFSFPLAPTAHLLMHLKVFSYFIVIYLSYTCIALEIVIVSIAGTMYYSFFVFPALSITLVHQPLNKYVLN